MIKNKDETKTKKINLEALAKSHIHDAINLFALAKNICSELNQINDTNKQKQEISKLKQFLNSSQVHFENIYQDLNSKQVISKSKIDLKDLLDLEIFDFYKESRLLIKDNIQENNAMVYGNFNLLSKAIFNLIENALKHSKSEVEVSSANKESHWDLKIYSKDNSIDYNFAKSIENFSPISSRHGLKSVSEILEHHNIEILVSSLKQEGLIINLLIPKYQNHIQDSNPDTKTNKSSANKKVIANKMKISKSAIRFGLVLLVLISIFSLNNIRFYSYKKALDKYITQGNQNLEFEASKIQNKINEFNLQIKKQNQSAIKKSIQELSIFERKLIFFNIFSKYRIANQEDLEIYKEFFSQYYEYYYLKSDYYNEHNKNLSALASSFQAILKQTKNFFIPDFNNKVLRSKDLELSSKLKLYLQDQEL
ncbi:MAG: hypothetical protein MK033_03075 [Candidatus Caenarcaniphilales bacterium]|nr:hypothetical protein [Candidatus Caenarcaniphilales bacterium]